MGWQKDDDSNLWGGDQTAMLNEADTRAKLIDPAIHKCGWTEDLIRREETAGTVEIINGKARRRSRGKIDYVLRVKVNVDTQPVALALIEAKKESLHPGHGLTQAKGYAACRRLTVRFVLSSNGHQFVEFDCFTGLTSKARPMTAFPPPAELRARYEHGMGFTLDAPVARPLLQQYHGGVHPVPLLRGTSNHGVAAAPGA